MVTRRSVLVPLLFGPLFPRLLLSQSRPLFSALAALEIRSRGKLGCAVLDLAKDKHTRLCIGQRMDERFPMCSTFKFLVTTLILKRVEDRQEQLDRRVTYTRADLLSY